MGQSALGLRRAGCTSVALTPVACSTAGPDARARPADEAGFTADGRQPVDRLLRTFGTLASHRGWPEESVFAYPDGLAIRAWLTRHAGLVTERRTA